MFKLQFLLYLEAGVGSHITTSAPYPCIACNFTAGELFGATTVHFRPAVRAAQARA